MVHYQVTIHGVAISIPDKHSAHAEALVARFPYKDLPTEIETAARFVNFAAAENADVAVATFQYLHQKYCSIDNIHVVVQQLKLTTEQAQSVIKGYYSVWDVLESREMLPDVPRPALFTHDRVKLTAMFGGYGGMDNYLDEAVWLLDVYRPLLADFVAEMAEFLLVTTQESPFTRVYSQPIDLMSWLLHPESRPNMEFLSAVYIASPILALIQLMHLMVLYKTLRVSPGELSQSFKSVISHSQGIAVAAMFPTLTDEKSFYAKTKKVMGGLISGCYSMQLEVPLDVLDADMAAGCIPSDGKPSPMVSIRGVPLPALEKLIAQFNSCCLSPTDHVYLALINTYDLCVVTGRLKVVMQFVPFLRQRCAEPSADQSNIPFSQRKPMADISYVNSSVVTHCRLLQSTGDWLPGFVTERDWSYNCGDTQVIPPVKVNGVDISSGVDLDEMVAHIICTRRFDWPSTLKGADATHIVDFSPGGFGAFARLARGIVDGSGVNIISCSSLIAHKHRLLGSKADLFQRDIRSVVQSMDWRRAFGPKLVQVKSDSQIHINSPMFHALGRPPVIVSAVEPSTTSVQLVAAAINSGYHAELPTTGIASTNQLQKRVADLVQLIEPGQDIALCCDYSNQEQWATLFPEIMRMRQAGQPIAGLSISGSIPTVAAATDIIAGMRDAGLRHITLKAATLAGIRAAIAISKVDRTFPVILQWMGGCNGGYHSWDDFYQPILDSYSLLRFHRNIILVAGSGIGDADTAMQYISGDWSVPFGRPPMPFDGVAIGSCVMVAKESDLSDATKQLIAGTAGVGPNEWMDTYNSAAGGVTSITGENGRPMHVIATRAALFVKELQGSIFLQAADKQAELLQQKRDSIIQRLNSDYIKPWFGKKADGSVAELQDMTYSEVIRRMIELMYVDDKSCWIDSSLGRLVYGFAKRVEDRFSGCVREYIIRHQLELDDNPLESIRCIERVYPDVALQLMATEDIQYFIMLCKRSGQSPVPFVPALDSDLETWMLQGAVSLSANSDYATSNDARRQLIPHGPVSAKFSSAINMPINDILGGIYTTMLKKVQRCNRMVIPSVDYIGFEPKRALVQLPIIQRIGDSARTYALPADATSLPELDLWLDILAGPVKSWLRAILTSPSIVQNDKFVANGVRRIMQPRAGQSVTVSELNGMPQKLEVHGENGELEVVIGFASPGDIMLRVVYSVRDECFDLVLKYQYCPSRPAMPVTEVMHDRGERIQKLYFGNRYGSNASGVDVAADGVGIPSVFTCQPFVVTADLVDRLCLSVGNTDVCYESRNGCSAPMDLFYLIAWEGTVTMLSQRAWNSEMFDAIHLANHVELAPGASMLRIGDVINTDVRVTAIIDTPMGKRIKIGSAFSRHGNQLATMDIEILFRGHEADAGSAFEHIENSTSRVILRSAADISVLQSRQWVSQVDDLFATLAPGSTLEFSLGTVTRYANTTMCSRVTTTGGIYLQNERTKKVHIASIEFDSCNVVGNPVQSYLDKYSEDNQEKLVFENGGNPVLPVAGVTTGFQAPTDCWKYSHISGDYNPIHHSAHIASYVGLPGPIIHGMWTSAATRAVVEKYVACGDPERFRSFKTDFVSLVFPGDCLDVELKHVGMEDGLMLLEGKTINQHGEAVMAFTAKIDQPKTSYIFTGQGAQFVGMGMDTYESSSAAKDVWIRADAYMKNTYGVSLLKIVRENPLSYQVKFSGTTGEQIRDNYMGLTRQVGDSVVQLIPGIACTTDNYDHRSANGLLNSTLFTQPIQTVMSLAQVADMRSKGLIQPSAMFAGHSLGEIGSLAAIGQIVSIEDAVELAFVRGLLLHASVERDDQGRSQYAMVSVNPSKVVAGFDERSLLRIVKQISKRGNKLLEVINYNVTDQQYVVTGHTSSLAIMGLVLDALASGKATVADNISKLITECEHKANATGQLVNGIATTVISGVDVPSHSRQLLDSVDTFRRLLAQKLALDGNNYAELCGRYIPNMNGSAFEVSREYFSMVHDVCKSPVLSQALANWDDALLADADVVNGLANTLLVELLAYQFTSPVRWITTMQSLIVTHSTKQVTEIGPAPVLTKMVKQACTMATVFREKPTVLHVSQDHDKVYYIYAQDVAVTSESQPKEVESLVAKAPAALPQSQLPVAENSQADTSVVVADPGQSMGAASPVPDKPIELADVIRAVIGQKMKRSLVDIPLTRSLKEIAAGKSILLNDIMGDMMKELSKQIPNKAEDMTIQQLASSFGSFHGVLGVHTRTLISKLFSVKLPNTFTLSVAKDFLQKTYGLGKQRQDGFFLLAVTMEPPSRLASDDEVKGWISSVAEVYSKKEGITYTRTSDGQSGLGSGQNTAIATINSAEFDKAQKGQRDLVMRQIQTLAKHIGLDMRKGEHMYEAADTELLALKTEMADIKNELGYGLTKGTQPLFDKRKSRHLNSYWNWARQDAFDWINRMILDGVPSDESVDAVRATHMFRNRSHSALIEMLEACLLSGGAKVVVTTSHYCLEVTRFYENVYRRCGARGSQLVVVPFNQGSAQDVESLLDYIYSPDGLAWDLDYVLPFAAIPETGCDATNIGSQSELAFRIMLTNVVRMIGAIKTAKVKYQCGDSPALVILPNSPNKGVMGDDGLYSAAKMALLSIYDRWHAEPWSEYVSVAGIDIGWVRGTNFTGPARMIYESLEKSGLRTYSRDEMTFFIFGLMTPAVLRLASQGPVDGNFTGGVLSFSETRPMYFNSRDHLLAESTSRRAIYAEDLSEKNIQHSDESVFFHVDSTNPLANNQYKFPSVKQYEQLENLHQLEGMVNLDKVVVVTGFGEVGPFGNAAMRWEMEAHGEFSLEGCVELAWIMGLIRHYDGLHPITQAHYVGWVDAKTDEPVQDIDVKARYESYILEHTGIRFVEPELHDGYDPHKKEMMCELQVDHDLEPFEASAEEAANFKRGNGDQVDVWENPDGSWSVKFLKGAVLLVPKALRFDRCVASQIPTGWDPAHFGIPQEIVETADPTSCYVLIAAMEALIRSGITDPYELYQYFHVSQVGHSIGSSANGAKSTTDALRNRWMDKNMHTGLSVTMMINSAAAYVNMLLMSSAGPIISTVGACATSFLSMEVGINAIQSGKAKVMVCGAFDSYSADTAYEFGLLGATSNSDLELACGRNPKEMCRPCTDTRSGYMESYGSGIFVLMSASAAIEMGAPIHGIVSQLGIAADKQTSNPGAPGQGVLTNARQAPDNDHHLLDIDCRREELFEQLKLIDMATEKRLANLSVAKDQDYLVRKEKIKHAAQTARNSAKDAWCNEFWKDVPEISPLRGGLAMWGLTADDIGIASFHGTSTALNDLNESSIVDRQLSYIGRTPGYPVPVTCQKSLTGHGKAASGSWQLHAILQAMESNTIPGIMTADNIDPAFNKFKNLVYPSRSHKVPQIKAALITSFGFGQVGAEALIVHPDYLFAALSKEELDSYRMRVNQRQQKSYRYFNDALVGKHPFVQIKDAPPFTPEQEEQVYMNPHCRAAYDPDTDSYRF
ncbi:fatty acid synthase alpha subunit Lsd1 [Linderina pennispora]|nr:fatty acid synthase alpha subunit Lsd1 [Linderina pennispora]